MKGKQPDPSDQAHQAADAEVETPPSGETKPKKAVKKNSPASKDAKKDTKKDTKKADQENKASKKKALACEEPPCKKSKSASSPKPKPKAKDVDEKCDKKPKSKAKATKSKVKKTIRKDRKSKSQKLKTAWEEDMLQEIHEDHEEEEPKGVEDANEPNEDQEECEEEQPMEDQENEENEQPDAVVAPPVAETQIETDETAEVKQEAAPSSSEPADSQVSLATLLKGNEQMLAQSIANIFESQSQTESQLFAGLLWPHLLAFVFFFFVG